MHARHDTPYSEYTGVAAEYDNPVDFLDDDEFLDELVDAVNHNFVLEVEASRAQDEEWLLGR